MFKTFENFLNNFLLERVEYKPEYGDDDNFSVYAYDGTDEIGHITVATKPEFSNSEYLPLIYIYIDHKYRGQDFFNNLLHEIGKYAKNEFGYKGINNTLTYHPNPGGRGSEKAWQNLVSQNNATYDKKTKTYYYDA